jgi:hypothetical protein
MLACTGQTSLADCPINALQYATDGDVSSVAIETLLEFFLIIFQKRPILRYP